MSAFQRGLSPLPDVAADRSGAGPVHRVSRGEEPVTFISAAFLAGLAAMAVPVIIHLIHRQRYPDRAFPTLRFFDKTVKHNVLQRRLIDRILLLLRVLALILLA